MKALKHIRAGLLHREIVGRVPERKPQKRRRIDKQQTTSAAQQFYNDKCSWRELELLIANNFGRGDMVVALTYDDKHLPRNKAGAARLMKKFLRKYREARRKRGEELKYIYVTEGYHGAEQNQYFGWDTPWEDKRLHHHIIVNGRDLDEIKSLWPYGEDVHAEPLDIHYYEELSKYLTKEAREFGRAKPGERTWSASRSLDRKIEVEYYELPDGLTLTAPEGAIDYRQWHERNPYGYGDCVGARYLLYPREDSPPLSYGVGRKAHTSNNFCA